jgi:hypothetical protein
MTAQAAPEALDTDVRLALFRHFAETGGALSADELAAAVGQPRPAVEESLRRLAEGHVIVLAPGGTNVWMANPFSAVPTAFRVEANGRTYWGNCIWDTLGIPAILGADATLTAGCGDCGEPLTLTVRDGALADGEGVVHFAVPARRWWDNIGFT